MADPDVPRSGLCHENLSKVKRPPMVRQSGGCGRNQPGLHRLGPEGPKRAAGDNEARKVERVVDRGMRREKPLALSPSNRLMRILGPVVLFRPCSWRHNRPRLRRAAP